MTLLDGAIAVSAVGAIPLAARSGLAKLGERVALARSDGVGLVVGGLLALCCTMRSMPSAAILCVSLTVSALTDIRSGVVLDFVIVVSLACLGTLAWAGGTLLAFALGASALFLAMAVIFVAARGGVGPGDVKLASVLGGALGASTGLTALALAFITGGIVAAVALAIGRARRGSAFPFAPFLALAAGLVLVFRLTGIAYP